MKDNETIKVGKSSQNRDKVIKVIKKKRRNAKIILHIVVIALTAASAIGVSFAIKNVNKQEKKTGDLGTQATYSRIMKLNNIYK